jgi:MFS family permease
MENAMGRDHEFKLTARYQVWVVVLLFTSTFINAIDRASLSVAAPILMKDLAMDPALMGLVLSAFFWPYALFNIPAGTLSDKYGAKKVLAASATIWSVCSALTGVASSHIHLFLARIGVGVGEAASFPVNAKIVNNTFPSNRRGTVIGWYTAGLRLGFAACPIIMAPLMTSVGWRYAFYITGLGSLTWVALWLFTFKEYKNPKDKTAQMAGAEKKVKIPWKVLLSSRTVFGLIACKFFQDYLFYLFVTWLPAYLIMQRNFSIMKMGTYGSLIWFAGFCSQPLIGFFSDWMIGRGVSTTVSRKSTIVIMQLLASVVVAVGFVDDEMTAVWLLILAVGCESASTAMLWTTLAEVAPRRAAGTLGGIMNTAGAIAGTIAPVLTGFVIKITGSFKIALLFGGVMVLLAALSMLFVVGKVEPLKLPKEYGDDESGPEIDGKVVAMGH